MDPHEVKLIEKFSPSNPELKELWKDHQELDRRIQELELSVAGIQRDQEIRALKKKKLVGKDRIAAILSQARI